jgi:hypothetical protein
MSQFVVITSHTSLTQESLEQERLKLEEVVKMEIKARMAAVDAVSDPMQSVLPSARPSTP